MALFSRRKKAEDSDPQVPTSDEADAAQPDAADVRPAGLQADLVSEPVEPRAAASEEADAQAAASVGISVSSYRGLGAQTQPSATSAAGDQTVPDAATGAAAPKRRVPRAPAEAPAATESIPGLRDNVVLREALAKLSTPAEPAELLEVARQLMQGHLFLRVKGDARSLLAEGKDVPLGIATVGDKQYVLAYSSGTALRESLAADRETDTSAMGQPVLAVLRYALAGPYAGLIIDNSSAPARAVLPRDLLQKMLDQADESLELKTLLAQERTDATAAAVAQALTRTKFWVAVGRSEEGRFGVAEARMSDGARHIELYSHPLEVASMGRGDQSAPMTAAQLIAALRAEDALSGVIVDPGGPWIRLSRADLAPLFALPA